MASKHLFTVLLERDEMHIKEPIDHFTVVILVISVIYHSLKIDFENFSYMAWIRLNHPSFRFHSIPYLFLMAIAKKKKQFIFSYFEKQLAIIICRLVFLTCLENYFIKIVLQNYLVKIFKNFS